MGDPCNHARTYTHPDVLTIGVRDGWADPETDPTRINWPERQAAAAIWFELDEDGLPINPGEDTDVYHGRNEMGHWGEKKAADALVTVIGPDGHRRILMVERRDKHGWAIPGGMVEVEDGESALDAAIRELAEEAGLHLPGASWTVTPPRYVSDPRASRRAWNVTVLCTTHLGAVDRFPEIAAGSDARRAAWIPADDYATLTAHLAAVYGRKVFRAHVDMLKHALA